MKARVIYKVKMVYSNIPFVENTQNCALCLHKISTGIQSFFNTEPIENEVGSLTGTRSLGSVYGTGMTFLRASFYYELISPFECVLRVHV